MESLLEALTCLKLLHSLVLLMALITDVIISVHKEACSLVRTLDGIKTTDQRW